MMIMIVAMVILLSAKRGTSGADNWFMCLAERDKDGINLKDKDGTPLSCESPPAFNDNFCSSTVTKRTIVIHLTYIRYVLLSIGFFAKSFKLKLYTLTSTK